MLFTKEDVENMTPEEFDEAVNGLIEKGLLTVTYNDGEPEYHLTKLGEVVSDHLISDPQDRN